VVLALEDLRLALAAGDAASVPLPIGSAVRDSLVEAVSHREGEMDLAVPGQGAGAPGGALRRPSKRIFRHP
jgi:hypothetical protein